MKIKSVFTTTVLSGVAALALVGHSARATLVYNAGDLFLGFRVTSGIGSSQDYLVNIGQASLYTAGTSFTVDAAKLGVANFDLGSDLTNLFGSDWNTLRGDGTSVQWAVIGTTWNNGDPNLNKILYVSKAQVTLGEHEPLLGRAPTGQGSTITLIQGVAGNYISNGVATANNSRGTLQPSGQGNSWASEFAFPSGQDFNAYSDIEGSFGLGTSAAGAQLDLYKLNPVNGQPGTLEGTFSIGNTGALTFTTAAVPEPSTFALGVAAAVLAIILQRRKKNTQI
jgi:hypothetical protein